VDFDFYEVLWKQLYVNPGGHANLMGLGPRHLHFLSSRALRENVNEYTRDL